MRYWELVYECTVCKKAMGTRGNVASCCPSCGHSMEHIFARWLSVSKWYKPWTWFHGYWLKDQEKTEEMNGDR